MNCTKGLHEMTEANTYIDGNGRRHCRGCKRIRNQGYRRAASHKEKTLTLQRTAFDDVLDKNPPVITWANRGGVQHPVDVFDPHAEKPSELRRQRQAAYYAQRKAAS